MTAPFRQGRELILGAREPRGGRGLIRSVRVSSVARYKSNFVPEALWLRDDKTELSLDALEVRGRTIRDVVSSAVRVVTAKGPGGPPCTVFGASVVEVDHFRGIQEFLAGGRENCQDSEVSMA